MPDNSLTYLLTSTFLSLNDRFQRNYIEFHDCLAKMNTKNIPLVFLINSKTVERVNTHHTSDYLFIPILLSFKLSILDFLILNRVI